MENGTMSSLPMKILAAILIAAFALASPANAEKARKHKKAAASTTTAHTDRQHRGPPYTVPGPALYFGGVYLGSDPDPNISFQIMRDVSGRFGGGP
jgi:hypothetical protein